MFPLYSEYVGMFSVDPSVLSPVAVFGTVTFSMELSLVLVLVV